MDRLIHDAENEATQRKPALYHTNFETHTLEFHYSRPDSCQKSSYLLYLTGILVIMTRALDMIRMSIALYWHKVKALNLSCTAGYVCSFLALSSTLL